MTIQAQEKNRPILETTAPAEGLSTRIMAHALAEATPEDERIPLARAFCYRIVAARWSCLRPRAHDVPLRHLLQSLSLGQLPEPAAATADSIGYAAACEPDCLIHLRDGTASVSKLS